MTMSPEEDAVSEQAEPEMSATTCPRRMAEFGPWERAEGLDAYAPGHGLVNQPRGCTFCGSLPSDDFMALVRDGAQISPSDKNYKAYIATPTGEGKFYFQHLTEEQRREFVDLLNAKRVAIGYPGRFYVLPFFVTVEG